MEESEEEEATPYEDSSDDDDMETTPPPPPGFNLSDEEREETRNELKKLLPILRAEKTEEEKVKELEELIDRQAKRKATTELKKAEKKIKKLEEFKEETQKKFELRVDKGVGPDRPLDIRVTWVPPVVFAKNEVTEGEWKTEARSLGVQVEMTSIATLRMAERIRQEQFPSGRGPGTQGKVKKVYWEDLGKLEQRTWRKKRAKMQRDIERHCNLVNLREERRNENVEKGANASAESNANGSGDGSAGNRKGRFLSTDSGYSGTPTSKPTREERGELRRREKEVASKTRINGGRKMEDYPSTSTPKPLPSKPKAQEEDVEMQEPAAAQTSPDQQQQQQPQQPDEHVLDVQPSISDMVTLDCWNATKKDRIDNERKEKKKEEERREERRRYDEREREERRKERNRKREEDVEIRRKERGRRENYRDFQRRH